MFRSFDLSIYSSNANQLLNNPCLRLVSLKVSCSFETGYTTADMRFTSCEEQEKKYKRYLRRFFVDQDNPMLDGLLESDKIRIVKQHVFPTIEGTVVVIDYQVKNRKAGQS